jgi:hypothetical protein
MMIGFFRKIRQHLLSENKVVRYGAYALGEIILVVIGILLALNINNWNEAKKDRIIERYYLLNLREDLQADIDWIGYNITDRYDDKLSALNKGKAYYQGNYVIVDTLSFLNELGYGGVYGNIVWAFKKTTYDELVNTGNFRKVEHDSLRQAVLDYYWLLNRTYESTANSETGYISFINSRAPFDRNNPKPMEVFDQQLLLKSIKSEEYYRLANLEITLAHRINAFGTGIGKRARELIDLIDKELAERGK